MCSREQGFYQTGGTEMTTKQTPLFDLLRIHADDIHSAHGHNKSSTLLSQAADSIVALESERDRLKSWIDTLQEEINVRAKDTSAPGRAIGASKRLIAVLEIQLSYHRAKANEYAEAVRQLDSERAANEQLQTELDAMTAERDQLRAELAVTKSDLAVSVGHLSRLAEAYGCDDFTSAVDAAIAAKGET